MKGEKRCAYIGDLLLSQIVPNHNALPTRPASEHCARLRAEYYASREAIRRMVVKQMNNFLQVYNALS